MVSSCGLSCLENRAVSVQRSSDGRKREQYISRCHSLLFLLHALEASGSWHMGTGQEAFYRRRRSLFTARGLTRPLASPNQLKAPRHRQWISKALSRAAGKGELLPLPAHCLLRLLRSSAAAAQPLMHIDHAAAAPAFPFFAFSTSERFNAMCPNGIQIFYHAHSVPGSIALVQISDQHARIPRALVAVLKPFRCESWAVLNSAPRSCFGIPGVDRSAPIAPVLPSQVCHADAAVHAARGYEIHHFIHELTS